MWDPPVIPSLRPHFDQSRAEPSARAVVAPFSIDLPPPATKPQLLVREPSSAPPPPSQTPSPASPRPESPNHRRSPLEVFEACSTVDPPLRSSSARTDRGNGFVVSSLFFPVFFPLPGCVAGAGERPSPSLPHLLPPAARGKSYVSRTVRLGGADSPPVRLSFVQRRCCLWKFAGGNCGRSATWARTVCSRVSEIVQRR